MASEPETKRAKVQPPTGVVRVAKYYTGRPAPEIPGFRTILIHVKNEGLGGALSPYVLKDETGCLLENIWQFSKLYPRVEKQRTSMSRWQPNSIIWEHTEEVHMDPASKEPTDAYWAWRHKGEHNPYAVRYPNGYYGRHKCVCSIWPRDPKGPHERLGYIEARKKIYCAEYARLAPKTEAFQNLKALLTQGVNLLLVEVDGPDPTLTYPPYDEISADSPGLLITEKTIRLLIEDERKPFGHGFVIAALLMDGAKWMK